MNRLTAGTALMLVVAVGAVCITASPVLAADRDGDHADHETSVRLTASEMAEFNVEVATAGAGRIATYVVLPGEVVPNADRVAHIVPRYAGIVQEVRRRVGDEVSEGEVLAVIESSASLTAYELTTLLGGTVIAKHITPGEAVTRESEAFVIADLADVWIELSIYQRDLDSVAVGQPVLISPGHHLPDFPATVSYVSPVVDEHTRTARARVVMPNDDGRWRPGMFVTARVAVESVVVPVAVPRTALQTVDGTTVVFVAHDDEFEPRPVEIGRTSETHVDLVAGLAAGERYVASGGFVLKAELGRGELSGGHAH